jgi:hypothetical protein
MSITQINILRLPAHVKIIICLHFRGPDTRRTNYAYSLKLLAKFAVNRV